MSTPAVPAPAIRPLAPGDLPAISRVHERACRIAYRFMAWDYSEAAVLAWYAAKMPEWDWGRAAVVADELAGFVAMTDWHIDQLFVDPAHQGRGIGRALLRDALARRLRPATLHCFAANLPARALYEEAGFVQADAWWDAGHGAVTILYRLD